MIRLTVGERTTYYPAENMPEMTNGLSLDYFNGIEPNPLQFQKWVDHIIFIDGGEITEDSRATETGRGASDGTVKDYSIYSISEESWNIINGLRFNEIDKIVSLITFEKLLAIEKARVEVNFRQENGVWTVLVVQISFLKYDWNRLWSISDFTEAFTSVIEEISKEGTQEPMYRNRSRNRFTDVHMVFPISNQDSTLLQEWSLRANEVRTMLAETERRLWSALNEHTLVLPLDVPEEIRTSFEQYLLYFVQFLKDVGMKANAQIQHEGGEAGKVLFSVTPADGKQALDKVRQALDLYLKLATIPRQVPNFSEPDEVQTLRRHVRFFQSEMENVEAILEKKDATIQLKNELIAQLREGRIFDEARQNTTEAVKSKPVVRLKVYDAKLFEIDLPDIFRRTRQWVLGDYANETLPEYYERHGLKLFERSEPSLPPSADLPALSPAEGDD